MLKSVYRYTHSTCLQSVISSTLCVDSLHPWWWIWVNSSFSYCILWYFDCNCNVNTLPLFNIVRKHLHKAAVTHFLLPYYSNALAVNIYTTCCYYCLYIAHFLSIYRMKNIYFIKILLVYIIIYYNPLTMFLLFGFFGMHQHPNYIEK